MSRAFKVFGGLFIFLLLLSGVCLGAFYFAYRNKVIAGVVINGFPLENRDHNLTLSLLEKYFDSYSRKDIVLIFGNERVALKQNNLGFTYDASATAREAMAIGRRGSLRRRLLEIYSSYRYGTTIKPAYVLNQTIMRHNLERLVTQFSSPRINASYSLEGDKLIIIPSQSGQEVSLDILESKIISTLSTLSFEPIEATYNYSPAEITSTDLENLQPHVTSILSAKWEFSSNNLVFYPMQSDIFNFFKVVRPEISNGPDVIVNEEGVRAFLAFHKSSLEIPPRAGVFEIEKGKVSKFEAPVNGILIDEVTAVSKVSQALNTATSFKKVEIPLVVVYAPSLANDYGVVELLGEGYSQFRGSSAGRVHNIGLAASRVSGTLVPPGEIFSFNQSVGEISVATGYDQAYIIAERKTVMGTGGGVCQVSTTVYRAGLNAGLEVVERHAHAYRVGYYEPPGLDATVYNPTVDLKFKNNTAHHILFVTEFSPKAWELGFRVYGTNDGREVTLLGPTIVGQKAPPEPIYQDDSSLPEGTTKQVDWAAWGALVTVQRIVRVNGAELINEELKSNYAPWQAIYLVGTKK